MHLAATKNKLTWSKPHKEIDFEKQDCAGRTVHVITVANVAHLRAYLPGATEYKTNDFEVFRLEVAGTYKESHPNFRNETENKLKGETRRDEGLQKLRSVILQGWPQTKKDLPSEVQSYWNYRDELTVNDGLVYKGDLVVIPRSMINAGQTPSPSLWNSIKYSYG